MRQRILPLMASLPLRLENALRLIGSTVVSGGPAYRRGEDEHRAVGAAGRDPGGDVPSWLAGIAHAVLHLVEPDIPNG
jgi:hypothetical protein